MKTKLDDIGLLIYPVAVVFEFWKPSFLPSSPSISFMVGAFYLFASFQSVNKRINLVFKDHWIYFLMGYFALEVLLSAIYFKYANGFLDLFNTTVFLNIIFLSLSFGHILQKPRLLNPLIRSFVFAVGVMGLLNFFGIGEEFDKGRLQSFGEDANTVANKAYFSILMSYFLIRSKRERSLIVRVLIIVSTLFSFYILINTGSRGPFLSLLTVALIGFFFSKSHIVLKVLGLALIVGIGSVYIPIFLQSDNLLSQRLALTVETGHTGRNEIWAAAIDAIVDNPQGVGKAGALPTMKKYLGMAMGTHNLFLWITLTSGFLGLILFLNFNRILLKRAYALFKRGNPQYIIYFISITLISLQAGGIINKKFLWFIYLLVLSSNISYYYKSFPKKSIVPR